MQILYTIIINFLGFFGTLSVAKLPCSNPRTIFATASWDNTVKIWNMESQSQCFMDLSDHSDYLSEITFSKDNKFLFSASYDKSVNVWELETGKLVKKLANHTGEVSTVDISPDGEKLASGGWDSQIIIWNSKTFGVLRIIKTQKKVMKLRFTLDGLRVISIEFDGIFEIFQVESGIMKKNGTLPNPLLEDLLITTDNNNNNYFVVGLGDNTAKMYKLDTDTLQLVREFKGHTDSVKGLAINPQNTILATASSDLSIILWDYESGNTLKTLKGHTKTVYSVKFNHDGKLLLSTSSDKTIIIWDVGQGNCLQTLNTSHTKSIVDLKILDVCIPKINSLGQEEFCICENQLFFSNASINICKKINITFCNSIICDASCETCSDAGQTKCLTCDPQSDKPFHELPTAGLEGRCLESCPALNQYGDYSTGRCQNTCPPPFIGLLINKKCVASCPPDYYVDTVNRKCEKCDLTCETCSAGGPSSCRTCSSQKATKYHEFPTINADGSCLSKCRIPSIYADDSTNRCYTRCPDSRWGLAETGKCEPSCPTNYYQKNPENQCENCHPDCATCSSGNPNNCRSCLAGSSKPYHDNPTEEVDGRCVSSCPSSYPYSDVITGRCYSKCPSGRFSDSSSQKCVSTCLSGFYGDTASNQCLPCAASCETCSSAGQDVCLSCKSTSLTPYHESPSAGNEGRCMSTCSSPNPFGDDSTSRCQSICPPPNFGLLDNNKCVTSCPSDYYVDTVNRKCEKCDLTCETCSAGGPSSCRTCSSQKATKYHEFPTINADGSCLSKCRIPSLYADDSTNRCYTRCPDSRWGLAETGKCEPSCPSNYYRKNPENQCEYCHPDCATCSSGNPNNCRSCLAGSSKPYHDNPTEEVDGYCVSSCPSSYPYSDEKTGRCYSKCPSGRFSDTSSQKCVSTCLSGFYGDTASNQCLPCAASCETCSSSGQNRCLSCKYKSANPYHESPSAGIEGRCMKTCSLPNPFGDDSTSRCQSVCQPPNFGLLDNNKCVFACPSDYYADTDNRRCEKCDPTCGTCTAAGPSRCKTCSSQKFTKYFSDGSCLSSCIAPLLFADDSTGKCHSLCPEFKWALPTTGKCESSCPSGYYEYQSISEKLCKFCNESIKDCKFCKDSYSCTFCQSGKFLLSKENSSVCVDKCPKNISLIIRENISNNCTYCPEGSFFDEFTNNCVNQRCENLNCSVCEKNRSICEKCKPDYVLDNSTCLAHCDLGYFKKGGVCLPCQKNCLKCSENNENQCLVCNTSFLLNGTDCISSCGSNSYFEMFNETSGICKSCHPKCDTCFGGDEMSCLTCKKEQYIVLRGTTCFNVCERNPALCYKDSPINESLKISIDPDIKGGGSNYTITFSKPLLYSNVLNLTKLVDVKVGEIESEKYSYIVNAHPEEKEKMILSVFFYEAVNSPSLSVNLNQIAPQYLKDENSLPIKIESQDVTTNITIPMIVEPTAKNGSKLNDSSSEAYSHTLYSLSSFIIFANVFSYTLNIERISTIWLYFDAIQTVSFFAFIDASHSKDLRYFLSNAFFSHADFISFLGKTINSNNNTILLNGKALNQHVYPNNFYIYLGTASFSANGFQALIFILILTLSYVISKLTIMYFQRRGEDDHKIAIGCETYKDIMFPVIIRSIYFFFLLLSLTSLLQMAYFNNPSGSGNFFAVITFLSILAFLGFIFRYVINKEEVYLSEEQVFRYEPIFANVEYEGFFKRNHHVFILIRKLLISIFIVALKAKPIAAAVLVLILFLLSIAKNLFRNPFTEKKIFFLAIGTDVFLAIIAIIEITIVKNDSDMRNFKGIIPITMIEKQASLCKVFIIFTLLICSIYFAIALVLFAFYACKHLTCLLSLFTGELGMIDVNPDEESPDQVKGTTAQSSRNLVEMQMAKGD